MIFWHRLRTFLFGRVRCATCGTWLDASDYAKHTGAEARVVDGESQVRCRFCHEYVGATDIGLHEAAHCERRGDGQQIDHVSVPPEHRYQGSLDDVPQWYVHDVCGAGTGMPEFIIRSYLTNPFLYNEMSFCTGCGDYVSMRTLRWEETGEILADYRARLQAEYVERHGSAPCHG